MRLVAMGVLSVTLAAALCNTGNSGGDEKPKFTIKQVMRGALADMAVMRKLTSGEADDATRKKFVEYCESLSKCKSPGGDQADWKMKTQTLLKLARQAAGGQDVGRELQAATNCKACHTVHKRK